MPTTKPSLQPTDELISLPIELKSLIFTHLSSQDLLALSATCRALHAIVHPVAYHHITLTWDNSPSQPSKAPVLQRLLRTLIEKPELASRVKKLDLRAKNCMRDFSDQGKFKVNVPENEVELDDAELTFFQSVVRDLGLMDKGTWDASPDHGTQRHFTMLGLLLAHCPQLEQLHMSVALLLPHEWFESLVHQGLISGGRKAAWMRGLKKFRLTCDPGSETFEPGFLGLEKVFLWPFCLPVVEELEIAHLEDPVSLADMNAAESNGEDYTAKWWPIDTPPSLTNLTSLRLTRCSAEPHTLDLVLRQTPSLRVLELDRIQHPVHAAFDLDTLKAALLHVAPMLERLSVRWQIYPIQEIDVPAGMRLVDSPPLSAVGRLGNFMAFSRLTDLEISLPTLFGAEDPKAGVFYPLSAVLPPTLQTLIITDDLYDFRDFRRYLQDAEAMAIFERYLVGDGEGAGEWKTSTPRLKKFVFDHRKRGYFIRMIKRMEERARGPRRTTQTARKSTAGKAQKIRYGYWDDEHTIERLRRMCEAQGIEGEVLWRY
jgi:hypothetical protein